MTVHGAIDLIYSRFRSLHNLKVYTYGHPRVGNLKFEEILSQTAANYRLVHNLDMVPHIPYCKKENSKCVSEGKQ